MEYNSQREDIIIPEYGRAIQKMIQFAKTLETKEERQDVCEHIVYLVRQMNPTHKNNEDYIQKLWRHLFKIAEYDIDIDFPPNTDLKREDYDVKPTSLNYPVSINRMRHYGANVLTMIDKAKAMEEGYKRTGYIEAIANYMKMANAAWNNEQQVTDAMIIKDLFTLSSGQLKVEEGVTLNAVKVFKKRANSNSNNKRKGSNSGGRSRSSNNNNNKKRNYKRSSN